MALAFALIKHMLKLENRLKEACDFGRDLWIASRAASCAKKMKPLYPKPHRNQLPEGLRPTLELKTFHRWPGVSCSPLPQGLHQPLHAPASAEVEGFSGETMDTVMIHFKNQSIVLYAIPEVQIHSLGLGTTLRFSSCCYAHIVWPYVMILCS